MTDTYFQIINFLTKNHLILIGFCITLLSPIIAYLAYKHNVKASNKKDVEDDKKDIREKISLLNEIMQEYNLIKNDSQPPIVINPNNSSFLEKKEKINRQLQNIDKKLSLITYHYYEMQRLHEMGFNIHNEFKKYLSFETERLQHSNLNYTAEHPLYKDAINKIYVLHKNINNFLYILQEIRDLYINMLQHKKSLQPYINGSKMILSLKIKNQDLEEHILEYTRYDQNIK